MSNAAIPESGRHDTAEEPFTKPDAKYGFFFDQNLCNGCKAC